MGLRFILTLMAGVNFSRSTVSLPGSAFADLPHQRCSSSTLFLSLLPNMSLSISPLAYSICLLTAYSGSLDSSTSADYPKLILVIVDGIAQDARSTLTTPQICLSLMTDFVAGPQGIQPHSYAAIAIVIIYCLRRILRL